VAKFNLENLIQVPQKKLYSQGHQDCYTNRNNWGEYDKNRKIATF